MKRITILALGSRGDVQPYAALGRALKEVGYRVRLVSFQDFESLVREQGLDFHPVKADAQLLVAQAAGGGMNSGNPLKTMRSIRESYGQLTDAYEAAFAADELRDSDAIINQLPGALYGRDLAEKLRIPHIIASVIPLAPTRSYPLALMTTQNLGGLGNRATYGVGAVMVWTLFRGSVNRFRQRLGLSNAPRFFPASTDPIVNGFSPRVVPRPPDWGSNVHVTGWWWLPEAEWTSPPALVDFLAAGEPPVFIGFGSMIAPDPVAMTRLLVDALREAGKRGVISSGWANLGGSLPDNVIAVDYVPYSWLFPQMAAVVHHGGSGTTGSALRAGVPSMVVSFAADQPYWGERTHALGVGVKSIPASKLTVEALAASIRQMTTDTATQARAKALGAHLRKEDGLGAAVSIIQRVLS